MIKLNFSKNADGLIPVIVQDWKSGKILMQAYMNEVAWEQTRKTGLATYWSRSRQELWVKGMTSGHLQKVQEILVDCDLDSVVLKVEQVGGIACHEGYESCFFRQVQSDDSLKIIEDAN